MILIIIILGFYSVEYLGNPKLSLVTDRHFWTICSFTIMINKKYNSIKTLKGVIVNCCSNHYLRTSTDGNISIFQHCFVFPHALHSISVHSSIIHNAQTLDFLKFKMLIQKSLTIKTGISEPGTAHTNNPHLQKLNSGVCETMENQKSTAESQQKPQRRCDATTGHASHGRGQL